jgi:hypothetical protein
MSEGPHCSEVQARESLFEAAVKEEAHAKGAMFALLPSTLAVSLRTLVISVSVKSDDGGGRQGPALVLLAPSHVVAIS